VVALAPAVVTFKAFWVLLAAPVPLMETFSAVPDVILLPDISNTLPVKAEVLVDKLSNVPEVNEVDEEVHAVPVVTEFHVIVVVFAAWARVRLALGADNADQDVEVEPAQELKTGTPPAVETRQSVPAPPVAVCNISPLLLPYNTPLLLVSVEALMVPTTSSAWAGVIVPIPTLPAVASVANAYLLVIVPLLVGAAI